MMSLYWMRFYSPGTDCRPITVPAPCQWWCSGTTDTSTIICAIVRSNGEPPWNALERWWPGLTPDSAQIVTEEWKPGDRFPYTPPSDNRWQDIELV